MEIQRILQSALMSKFSIMVRMKCSQFRSIKQIISYLQSINSRDTKCLVNNNLKDKEFYHTNRTKILRIRDKNQLKANLCLLKISSTPPQICYLMISLLKERIMIFLLQEGHPYQIKIQFNNSTLFLKSQA